jgi:hypothetical protein
MSRLLLLFFILTSFFFIRAQDTIIKRNSEKIISKITEVNPNNVRYKRSDNLEGPIYTLEKEQINYIVYFNGIIEKYDSYAPVLPPNINAASQDLSIQTSGKYYYYKELRITEPDMHAIVKRLKDPKFNLMVKSVENKKFIQNITFIASIPTFVSGLYIYETNKPMRSRRGRTATQSSTQLQAQRNGISLMVAALACDVISFSFMLDRRRHNHLLVNAYNKTIALR